MTGGLDRRLSALERRHSEMVKGVDENRALWTMYAEARDRHQSAVAEGREPATADQAAVEWLKLCEARPGSTVEELVTELSDEHLDGLAALYEAALGPDAMRQLESEARLGPNSMRGS